MSSQHTANTEQHTYVLRSEAGIWLAEFDFNPGDPWGVWSAVRSKAFAHAEELKRDGYGDISIYHKVRSIKHELVATV